MCAGDFEPISQGASTLWPDRKSQKISERRIRLKWIKCSPRTKANPVKTGRATTFGQEEAQTSPTRSSWGWLAPPPQLCHVVLPHWLPKSVLQGRAGFPGWLLPINTRGGDKEWNTTHTTQQTKHITHHSPPSVEPL